VDGIHIHEHDLLAARQQRHLPGQGDQGLAQHGVQLLHMPVR